MMPKIKNKENINFINEQRDKRYYIEFDYTDEQQVKHYKVESGIYLASYYYGDRLMHILLPYPNGVTSCVVRHREDNLVFKTFEEANQTCFTK